ncbi:DNA-3-methyladenine glycosylase I [Oceanicoccus sagamiensis]|uniref:3-methyladenine DNA glycosylase n=1 Tax=Oceanicoccus sagamiensis TaxID=716816 RepID=A0A1X9NCY2_9GAMM|nr:DNA-3-methyladenine glycosylase I [Oceanicoccus sagamiensis]ARN75890.1 3-methyladenine DNA glycosylase [Oceanicoccus sagamiensis]
MKDFDWIYQHVLERLGSAREVERYLSKPASAGQLKAQDDAFYLSTLCRRVFRAGLKHSVVDNKWPGFEQAFFGFNPRRVAMMSDEEMDALMGNTEIIRHWQKIKSVRYNAGFMLEIIEQHGSIGHWLAQWPAEDIVALWTLLKKEGAQLGGNSGPYFLRMVGKDTFILTEDLVVALKAQGIVDKKPDSQKDLKRVQGAFNHWAEQSGRPLCQISQLLAMTVNY